MKDWEGELEKDREGGQGKRYLERGGHYAVSKKPGTREILRNLQRWPQLRI